MSGIYEGPNGQRLYGDGREVERGTLAQERPMGSKRLTDEQLRRSANGDMELFKEEQESVSRELLIARRAFLYTDYDTNMYHEEAERELIAEGVLEEL